MQAGFAREGITPPLGTRMLGFGRRDIQKGCEAIHDDLYAGALFIEHAGEQALIMGCDLCFFGRAEADRYRGALGRKLGLAPRQILLNTSHTHCGPATAAWGFSGYAAADHLYLDELERKLLKAAVAARAARRAVTVWAGRTRTNLPVSRRKPDGRGGVDWRPYPEGTICDSLPLALFKDAAGKPVSLLYSVACHPSTKGGWDISADYPGVASRRLDAHLGLADGGSLFLQGCGGDAKARPIADGRDERDVCWRQGTWADIEAAGRLAADAARVALDAGLRRVEPVLCAHELEMGWPLEALPTRAELERLAGAGAADELKQLWAKRQVELLDRGNRLPDKASITLHGLQLGTGLRLIGIEGEAVAEIGLLMEQYYGSGVTFALGYTDGAQLYLPAERMLSEGGYEVESYYEYGFPARLAPGFEKLLRAGLDDLHARGIA